MSREYCLQVLAELCDSAENQDQNFYFKYDRKLFKLLDIDTTDIKKLLAATKKSPNFLIKEITLPPDYKIHLALFFCPQNATAFQSNQQLNQQRLIINQFFDYVRNTNTSDEALHSHVNSPEISLAEFYEKLREAHVDAACTEEVTIDITHLRPVLRKYQENGIKWMLNRETKRSYLPSEFVEATASNIPGVKFYLNLRTFEVTDQFFGDILIPAGGILCDEMGLGKTVEMLALILNNSMEVTKSQDTMFDDTPIIEKCLPTQIVKCICLKNIKEGFIQCTVCQKLQHTKCLLKNTIGRQKRHICPDCFKRSDQKLIDSGTTIIVSPISIKMQWLSEIKRHISDPNFKVLVYEGVNNSGWISPFDLAEYNVVLTDYNVLRAELYYTNTNERKGLRQKRRFMNLTSPLTLVNWWRVVLDEAQMVESKTTNSAKMVQALPAVHRWSVTGTPIEKNIDNLYGLVYFIDYYPYTDYGVWKTLMSAYRSGNPNPLIEAMKYVMWRTCKSSVIDQLGIPPQQEIIHTVRMSDLQKFFYRSEHAQCAVAFQEKATRLGKSVRLSKMNSQTLNKIMEPLRKLRQDCSVPSIFQKTDQTITKKTLSPQELHVHMISNRELECKSQLRSLVSSLNGIAGLMIIKKEFCEAAKNYKKVLRLAKEYTGNICVDTLLQIHALNSICDLPAQTGDVEIDRAEYQEQLKKLEWKYIETYFSLAEAAIQVLEAAIGVVDEKKESLDAAYAANTYEYKNIWYREYLNENKGSRQEDNLLERINSEIRTQYPNLPTEDLKTLAGVDFVITMWLDKMMTTRDLIQDTFDDLSYFYDNIKPNEQLEPSVKKKIENLIETAFKCHLDPKLKEDINDYDESFEPAEKVTCHLCLLQNELNKYECVIFDKRLQENKNVSDGSWKPSYQESILKLLLSSAKNNNRTVLAKFGTKHLSLIEAIKKEFKDYSKFWVEINYTASAYDELNMCKYQLQVLPSVDIEKESNLQIYEYEIDETLYELELQREMAEKEFVRLKGSLKYLHHLKEKDSTEPEICPICKNKPEERYSVLECGHHMCIVCLSQMAVYQRGVIKCSICRNQQTYKDIYYVTCNPTSSYSTVLGNFSNKIIEIVETVLHLKRDEPDVKIIIFSQWETILGVVASALEQNSILYRSKSAKFHICIEEFKNSTEHITCLLLPLRFGSKGLNLVEATHVFLVEPILDPGEELQAVGRIHRIGQCRPTFVHRFIVKETIEQTIFETISNNAVWKTKDVSVENLQQLFNLDGVEGVEYITEPVFEM